MLGLDKAYRWFSSSLANQLLFTYLLIIIFSLMAVTLWALLTIRAESINDLSNSLKVEAVNLALEIDNDLELDSEDSRARIQKAAERRATNQGVEIIVVDSNGHVLADSSPEEKESGEPDQKRAQENISKDTEVNEALAGIIAVYKRNSPATNTNTLFVAYPVRSRGVTAGVIRIGVPITEVEQRLRKNLIVFLEIIFATGVVTVLISLWLAERFNRPVKEMSKLAKEISLSTEFTNYLPVGRRDEIGELSLSFNQMVGRLKEQERIRQEFIANASHELKTPVMAIGSVVEALQAGAAEDPELRKKFLESLEKLSERQRKLIAELLDVSKLDSTPDAGWSDKVNISQVLNECVEQVKAQAEKKGVSLSVPEPDSGGQDFSILGNSSQLQRAIVNLLTNAINYTQAGGSVSLEVQTSDYSLVQIHVKDSGQGIAPEDIPHVFERFYRADKSRTRELGGAGLGLAIAREIVARHHGLIDVDSTPGRGSTFTITLPLAEEAVS